MSDLFGLAVPIVIIVVIVIGFGITISRLYRRASPEVAFVRTGMGGAKAVLSGGAMVLPVLHEETDVGLKTLSLFVSRREVDALITKDSMRVDVGAEFYVRVRPDRDSVVTAARTLGGRTMNPDALKELVEGKFVDALRSVAATMTLEALHEKRADFVQQVQNTVAQDLLQNGLELESVSLTALDQTDARHLNPDNRFDAIGLTNLTQLTEQKKRERRDIEEQTRVQIAQREADADREAFMIEQERAKAAAEKEAAIAEENARSQASQARSQYESDQAAERARIAKERAIKEADIERSKSIEIAEQSRRIEIAKKSEEVSQASAAAEKARADEVEAQEAVKTAGQVAAAERDRQVAVLAALREAEEQATAVKVAATAERQAAEDRAEAVRTEARAAADQVALAADAERQRLLAEAEGKQALYASENSLSDEIIRLRLTERTLQTLPEVMQAAVEPAKQISNISVVDFGGLGRNGGSGAGNLVEGVAGTGAGGSVGDGILKLLLGYQMYKPLVDKMLTDAGIGDLSDLAGTVADLTGNGKDAAPATVEPADLAKKN